MRHVMDAVEDSGYGSVVKKLIGPAMILLAVLPSGRLTANDFAAALERAREAGVNHRYNEVIELLTPFNTDADPEAQYITAAEIGRAYFHLGRYGEAHRAFREAVRLHPERPETAIYLEATSYLMGDSEQAYAILRELLKSGARDLYLAVTLPGERRFLADPRVREIIEEFSVDVPTDIERARIFGVGLGDSRSDAVARLDARSSDPEAPALTASAGPALIWAFVFDPEQRLEEILLQAENLYRYTPYRLRFDDKLDWSLTPAAAIASWGPPSHTANSREDGIAVSWDFPGHRLTLDFGRPRPPGPLGLSQGAAMLRTVQLTRQTSDSTDRMTE
ncbi:MAG: tetratricopeptide repeat protein [Thermoanaerobaculales bacterium]|nr:tetratricopeptide repeat protein [Thermoanaerobaculales bacterium]